MHDIGIARAGAAARKLDYFWREAGAQVLNLMPKTTRCTIVGVVGVEDCGVSPIGAAQVIGLRLRVRTPEGNIIRPLYRGDYGALRTNHGTDACLIGKPCDITYIGEGTANMEQGVPEIVGSPQIRPQNESKVSNIVTTGAMYGNLIESPKSMLPAFEVSDSNYMGE